MDHKPIHRNTPIFNWHSPLMKMVLQEARSLGYKKIYLDTLESMQSAQALYRYFGFYEIKAYYDNPLDNVIYMEKLLDN